MKQIVNVLCLITLILFTPATIAKTSDADQPVNISADSVEIHEKEKTSIYRGNVKITRGSMQIEGDLIQIYSDDEGLNKIHVEGKPATFKQLNDLDEEISSQSEQMDYSAESGILTLVKDAILMQNQHRFTSQHIVYDTRNDIVQAGQEESQQTNAEPGRVTITIQPKKKDSNQQ